MKLQRVYYNWKPEQWKTKGSQREIGLLAQDVEKVIPELVSTDKDVDLKAWLSHLNSIQVLPRYP